MLQSLKSPKGIGCDKALSQPRCGLLDFGCPNFEVSMGHIYSSSKQKQKQNIVISDIKIYGKMFGM